MENAFGILACRFRVLLGNGAMAKGCERHCFDKCGVAEETYHGRADRAPAPADDIATLQKPRVCLLPDENYRILQRRANIREFQVTSITLTH